MNFDTLDDLFADAGKVSTVTVPGITQPIYVRQLSIGAMDDLQQYSAQRIRFSLELCARVVCKSDGSPFKTPEDWGRFGAAHRDLFNAICSECMRFSGLLTAEQSETAGNASGGTGE